MRMEGLNEPRRGAEDAEFFHAENAEARRKIKARGGDRVRLSPAVFSRQGLVSRPFEAVLGANVCQCPDMPCALRREVLRPLLVALVASLGLGRTVFGQETLPATTAREYQPRFPVLVRNPSNPVTQILLIATQQDLELQSLEFELDPGSNTGAIDSFEVFHGGAPGEYQTTHRFGAAVSNLTSLRFEGRQSLVVGSNIFWLSCRLKPGAVPEGFIAARTRTLRTTAGKTVPAETSGTVQHHIGVALRRHQEDGIHTYRIPALTTSKQGTLLCAYDMRRRMGRDLQEDIDIGLSRSVDGGRSWEPMRVIMDMGTFGGLPQELNGCSDPGIVCDQETGEIFCFAVWMHGKPGKHQWREDGSEPGFEIGRSAQFLRVRSKDDGRTWNAPENLTRVLKRPEWWLLAPAPQQGIQLANGTLVMPIQGRDAVPLKFSTLMHSSDHGNTWTVGAPAFAGSSECQVAELSDGTLMLNMRNERAGEKHRAVAVTRDLGASWTEHPTSRKALIEPTCNGSLLRVQFMQDGRKKQALLFSNPHNQTARTHQTIQVSFDDGATWPETHHRLLDEGRGAGYSTLTQIDADHVGIVYEGSRSHLVFERFHLKELGLVR